MELIQIEVKGRTGSGKSHVMAVIEEALKKAYGRHAQVASHDLSVERALAPEHVAPKVASTVFVLSEINQR